MGRKANVVDGVVGKESGEGVKPRLETVLVPLGQLKPNAYNPNRQSDVEFELLLRSMEEDGFTQPILAQKGTNIIIDGEHRWRAATILNMSQVPVVFVEMTPEQMRVATLRHNRARGSEDMRYVAEVFRELQEMGGLDWAKDSLMLDDLDVDSLLNMPELRETMDTELRQARAENPVATPEDVAALRQAEREAEQREAAREYRMNEREALSIFRMTLRFTPEEGMRIKRVMHGQPPAQWLLRMMEKYG